MKVSDGNGGEDTVTINVTINAMPDAPVISETSPQAVSMSEDGNPTDFELTLHATDVDGGTLTWSIASPATHGSASAEGTGDSKAIGYVPEADFSGSDSFTVQVSDGSLTDALVVNVPLDPVYASPGCLDTSLATLINTQGQAAPLCSDIDSVSLTYSIVDQPAHGTGSVASDLLTYMPSVDYSGVDSFTYQAYDGVANSNIASVTVEVSELNHAPVCNATSLTTNEDTAGLSDPLCADLELDPLTYSITSQPAHGSASVVDGHLLYTPAENYHGPDSFDYKANDGQEDSAADRDGHGQSRERRAGLRSRLPEHLQEHIGWADPLHDVEGDASHLRHRFPARPRRRRPAYRTPALHPRL